MLDLVGNPNCWFSHVQSHLSGEIWGNHQTLESRHGCVKLKYCYNEACYNEVVLYFSNMIFNIQREKNHIENKQDHGKITLSCTLYFCKFKII